MKTTAISRWSDYWKAEDIFTEEASRKEVYWRTNVDLLVRGSEPVLRYGPHDRVLDIGCGPAYLASALRHRVESIHCLDINPSTLELGRDRLRGATNVFFHELCEDDYTSLSAVADQRFSIIICSSTIQYYQNKREVERLIREVRAVAAPGAKLLIADIVVDQRLSSMLFHLLKTSIHERFLLEALRLLYREVTSSYRRYLSTLKLLAYSVEELQELIDRMQLNASILSAPMSMNTTRRHLLIEL